MQPKKNIYFVKDTKYKNNRRHLFRNNTSQKTMEFGKNIFKIQKRMPCQLKILYPVKRSFKIQRKCQRQRVVNKLMKICSIF